MWVAVIISGIISFSEEGICLQHLRSLLVASRTPSLDDKLPQHPHILRLAKNIILNEGKIFLTYRNAEPYAFFWDVPGGEIEHGESPREAALRELREELLRRGLDKNFPTMRLLEPLYFVDNKLGKVLQVFPIFTEFPNPLRDRYYCDVKDIAGAEYFSLNNLPDRVLPLLRVFLQKQIPAPILR